MRNFILTFCCLVFIFSTCIIIDIEDASSDGSKDSASKNDYLQKLRKSLRNLAKSFKSDPLTNIEPLQKTLNQQQEKLDSMRTELSDIIKLVPIFEGNGNIAKRSLKSTEERPTCPSISPLLKRALIVNQVSYFQSIIAKSCLRFQTVPTLKEVEEKLGPKLGPGGKYRPTECIQRQKVAFIVPCR